LEDDKRFGLSPAPWRSSEFPRVCSPKTDHRLICQCDSQKFQWHLAFSSGKMSGTVWHGISAIWLSDFLDPLLYLARANAKPMFQG
jgi:hypothetical protein